jgi:PAS domain S-box-containing protein
MALLDDHRRHIDVNDAYLQLLGYGRPAFIGRPFYEFVVDGPILSPRQVHALLIRQSQVTGMVDLKCADGKYATVEIAAHPEIVTGKQLILLVGLRVGRRSRRDLHGHQSHRAAEMLTPREVEIVELIAVGLSGPEIGTELHLAHNTVRTHVHNAMVKLGAHSRAQLVAKALGEGMFWPKRP